MAMKSRELSLVAVFAALYAGLVTAFAPLSFLMVQVRIANALIGLVPLVGMPAVYGIALGVLLGNLTSPLGAIDLVSAGPSFLGLLAVYKLRKTSVTAGLFLYTLTLSLWVAFMLYYVLGLPYGLTFIYVFVGIAIATVGLGYALYKGVHKVMSFREIEVKLK
ncbi:QueT transporter family protein [Candidatus Hecatella orcuttiae]|uniref:QueT transporter family protein n=1 Tax=Candidatus Hecatella orcuttiae TaxID=1935119 RepID=UPI002867C1ED|nr:QueT transporter family protein [Candidatus Hecatella orcuttiae]